LRHEKAKERAKAVGLSSNKLKKIESDFTKKAGMQPKEWQEKHPLESLPMGQYDNHRHSPQMSNRRRLIEGIPSSPFGEYYVSLGW
jgi:hypothetical protein